MHTRHASARAARMAAATPFGFLYRISLAVLLSVLAGGVPAADYPAIKPMLTIESGGARLERLGPVFIDGAGPMVMARAGDWRMSNAHLSVTLASVDDVGSTVSQPIGGYRVEVRPDDRFPGAIIDVTADDEILDFLGFFTQGVGFAINGPIVKYDTAEPLRRDDGVGLRLTGSPSEISPARLETTYWLGGSSRALRVETRWATPPPDAESMPICDVGVWGAGVQLIGGVGHALRHQLEGVRTPFYEAQGGRITMGVSAPQGTFAGMFRGLPSVTRAALVAPGDAPTTTPAPRADRPTSTSQDRATTASTESVAPPIVPAMPMSRDLWIVKGEFSDVTQEILRSRAAVTGAVEGTITVGESQTPVKFNRVLLSAVDIKHPNKEPILYTIVRADDKGHYKVDLPPGFYLVKPESEPVRRGGRVLISVEIEAGKTKQRDLKTIAAPRLRVKAVDAATSAPLAARLRFEPIPPTPPKNFGFPKSADGYMNDAYIPAEGREFELPEGGWVVYGSHGIRYSVQDAEAVTSRTVVNECTLALKESNPTPGWFGVELGVRTKATPGCTIEPRDIALMCAAEGLDWVVSGDFETLTDLGPEIKALGLGDRLGHSLGFRTLLPARPEWGQFLVFPVGKDAPDPAKARREWSGLTTAQEFIDTLRRVYPGALIQVELPFAPGDDVQGYFAIKGRNPFETSFDPNPSLDFDVDAINILPARQLWDLNTNISHWYNHLIRGRFYLCSTSNAGRTVFGAEPGYPRLLVRTGDEGVGQLTEERLIANMRAHHVQITTGPFIDLSVGDARPGDTLELKEDAPVRLRIAAPPWVNLTSYTFDKEGMLQRRTTMESNPLEVRRVPESGNPEPYETMPLSGLRLLKTKDTLLDCSVRGQRMLDPEVPLYHEKGQIPPFAMTFPIVVDANGNGKYDPLKAYLDKGR